MNKIKKFEEERLRMTPEDRALMIEASKLVMQNSRVGAYYEKEEEIVKLEYFKFPKGSTAYLQDQDICVLVNALFNLLYLHDSKKIGINVIYEPIKHIIRKLYRAEQACLRHVSDNAFYCGIG